MHIDVQIVLAVIGILSAVVASIGAIMGIYIKMVRSIDAMTMGLGNVNKSLELQTEEIVELKGYKTDIDRNTRDILVLQETKVSESRFNILNDEFIRLKTEHRIKKGENRHDTGTD